MGAFNSWIPRHIRSWFRQAVIIYFSRFIVFLITLNMFRFIMMVGHLLSILVAPGLVPRVSVFPGETLGQARERESGAGRSSLAEEIWKI
jgi:hypothetical protein